MCVCVAVCVCTRQTDRIRVGARSTALSNQSCIVVYDCKESGVRGSAARGWIVGAVGLVRLAGIAYTEDCRGEFRRLGRAGTERTADDGVCNEYNVACLSRAWMCMGDEKLL